mmetsp:Transcript_35950/g.52612  ORF Transcript_35950/g.52612 Transcript_35950/m.52612 type:complete len:106 (+) Transcript_35950:202-519(+)
MRQCLRLRKVVRHQQPCSATHHLQVQNFDKDKLHYGWLALLLVLRALFYQGKTPRKKFKKLLSSKLFRNVTNYMKAVWRSSTESRDRFLQELEDVSSFYCIPRCT